MEIDKCILEYIIMHKRFTEVSGMKLWMDMQKQIFKRKLLYQIVIFHWFWFINRF